MQHSNEQTGGFPIAWLLLRDGHAVPLLGFSPNEIKESRRKTVPYPEAPLKHRQGLNAIIDTLGFPGDFGTYTESGWPSLQRFLSEHRCTQRRDLFRDPEVVYSPFYFMISQGPNRRDLADRLYASGLDIPRRVFLGTGIDWHAWDEVIWKIPMGSFRPANQELMANIAGMDREAAIRYIGSNRVDLTYQWGFLDDKLIAGPIQKIVNKTYWARQEPRDERERAERQLLALTSAFRRVFDEESAGWVDVLRYNANLTILRATDGGWDAIWRDLRENPPPKPEDEGSHHGIHPSDLPATLAGKTDLARRLYFRRGVWEEAEAHAAEQHFYDVGHTALQRQMTNDVSVRYRYLRDTGALPLPRQATWEGPPPAGFSRVQVGDRTLLVTELVTLAEFRMMLAETDYLLRRSSDDDDWGRANDGGGEGDPVGATWKDAQAFCAWKERKLGVALRLLTRAEHRAVRPFFSERYEKLAPQGFMWENHPPRPIIGAAPDGSETRTPVPSAVAWSEPRFEDPGPDLSEFPSDGGISTSSRKRWIKDFPPRARWTGEAWANHNGLHFIDAWDAYEWCQETGFMAGRFAEDYIGPGSWGAYKNVKIGFRVAIALG